MKQRRPTATSNFGVSRRESHDASGFYARFRPPEVSDDAEVLSPVPVAEPFVCGDARSMSAVADGSVALVVTSPPYFAGKQYEEELTRDGVPASYLEYLDLLRDVFAECARTLEPGGRIAVNVANLGRKPYRSLSADVIGILQDDLGLLLRGEVMWQKSEGASGSCAWGSFRSAANPVLRDITERVIIASKGRFDRARTPKQRRAAGLPHANTVMADDFMALTLDVWHIPAESARRVGHPAPFPVELPEQLIRLYTYADDLVLDPFMGSGSSLAAAARLGRRYVGYDLDPAYVELARRRVAELAPKTDDADRVPEPDLVLALGDREEGDDGSVDDVGESFEVEARREGTAAARLAEEVLTGAGFTIAERNRRIPKTGVAVGFVVTDAAGEPWYVDVAGTFTAHRPGLLRSDALWRTLGRAHAIRGRADGIPLLVLTPHLPRRPGDGDTALRAAGPDALFDVVDLLADEARQRLQLYAKGGARDEPRPGFWTPDDLARGGGRPAPSGSPENDRR